MSEMWRVGEHYRIHVYAGDRPVATFHDEADAAAAVQAYNAAQTFDGQFSDGPGFTIRCSYCSRTVTLPNIDGRLQLAPLEAGWTGDPHEWCCPDHADRRDLRRADQSTDA